MSVPVGLVPSFLLPEIYSPWKAEPGFIAGQIARAARDGFYRAVEISRLPNAEDRAAVRSVCAEHDIYVATWLTDTIDAEKLDLSSTDRALQERSVEAIKRVLPEAKDAGTRTISMVGGPDPGPADRERGFESFYRSMTAIAAAAADLGMSVMFEPLDRFAHKKRLIGPTDEIAATFARIQAEYPSFGLAFDTAHAALNEEDFDSALTLARGLVANMHLSNAVLDKTDPRYGDHHMMPGAPGFLTVERAAGILSKCLELGICKTTGLRVAVEARAQPTDARQHTADVSTAFLKDVFTRVSGGR